MFEQLEQLSPEILGAVIGYAGGIALDQFASRKSHADIKPLVTTGY